LIHSFDFAVFVVFVVVQTRITLLCMRASAARFKNRKLRWARLAIVLFNAALLLGYACSFSAFLSWLGGRPRLAMFFGAGSLAYLMTVCVVLGLHAVLSVTRKVFRADADPMRRKVLNTAGSLMMAAPFAVMGYGSLVERSDFRVRELDLPIPQLPPDLDGVRILQLSDIHLSAFLSEAELRRVIDMAIELRPHVAVVTGDLISTRGDPLDACLRQIARLKADSGIFGCLGNHERYADAEDYTATAAARLGVRFLRHEAEVLRFGNAKLNLAGIDYQRWSDRRNYLHGMNRLVVPGTMNVLLSHNPDVFPVAAHQGYNLLLAGHTHGGQVAVEILDQSISPASFTTPYVYGLYHRETAAAYVTRGIGTIGIPARIGAPPEISVLRLRKA
jgi:predicted MPP superfamily phosphohydrolase